MGLYSWEVLDIQWRKLLYISKESTCPDKQWSFRSVVCHFPLCSVFHYFFISYCKFKQSISLYLQIISRLPSDFMFAPCPSHFQTTFSVGLLIWLKNLLMESLLQLVLPFVVIAHSLCIVLEYACPALIFKGVIVLYAIGICSSICSGFFVFLKWKHLCCGLLPSRRGREVLTWLKLRIWSWVCTIWK